MRLWWGKSRIVEPVIDIEHRAVAYYRQASQDKRENSIALQQKQVQAYAAGHGLKIIREFCDRGKSGSTAEGRPAFLDLIENWVKKRNDFKYILCLDLSRWGRFLDIELSAKYRSECKSHGKEVIYTDLGSTRDINSTFDRIVFLK